MAEVHGVERLPMGHNVVERQAGIFQLEGFQIVAPGSSASVSFRCQTQTELTGQRKIHHGGSGTGVDQHTNRSTRQHTAGDKVAGAVASQRNLSVAFGLEKLRQGHCGDLSVGLWG